MLEAEAGGYLTQVVDDGCGEFSDRLNFSLPVGTNLYAAPPVPGNQVSELTMLVKQLASQLKKAKPDCKLPEKAMGYLTRNGLISVEDALR
ncbi:hypothetical protein [Escherichia coli]|uniref:hypothetical protein n=1 Tax=Escherichia coli TaxID=562 RepID=UPI00200B4FD7|nr:hypothetical protein [Escherichia coli]